MPLRLIAVVGPTASGKTALAVRLAHRLNGEIVSADSMQIYRRMEIGTAAPTEAEKEGIPHHMIGILEPNEPFSCADYAARAAACIRGIAERGKTPILCGGTGLYLDSLLRGGTFSDAASSPAIRDALLAYAEQNGREALHARLRDVDPASADAIHPNNVRRVVRALEIHEATGVTKTEWDRRSLTAERQYDACILALDYLSRQRLYDRIDRRVTAMIDAGLIEEARALYDSGLLSPESIAGQAIGYKEWLPYFSGSCTAADAAEQIRLASRRYAKRQLTWFRRYPDAVWLYPDGENMTPDTLLELALASVQNRL